jgi:hypothetical protein
VHVRNLKARRQSGEIDLRATSFNNHVSFGAWKRAADRKPLWPNWN